MLRHGNTEIGATAQRVDIDRFSESRSGNRELCSSARHPEFPSTEKEIRRKGLSNSVPREIPLPGKSAMRRPFFCAAFQEMADYLDPGAETGIVGLEFSTIFSFIINELANFSARRSGFLCPTPMANANCFWRRAEKCGEEPETGGYPRGVTATKCRISPQMRQPVAVGGSASSEIRPLREKRIRERWRSVRMKDRQNGFFGLERSWPLRTRSLSRTWPAGCGCLRPDGKARRPLF